MSEAWMETIYLVMPGVELKQAGQGVIGWS